MLIICHSILKKELQPLENYFSQETLIKTAQKAQGGLGKKLKGSFIPNSTLVKLSLTSSSGAGRVVFLVLQVASKLYFPVVLRLKKDKKIGENMSMENQYFQKLLKQNLVLVMQDFKAGRYEEIMLE